ncbi:hypothetical protein DH2020_047066 [Rehmannia glutinosa]|uniref:THO complex subunit 1 n=1 Tax=Rehmannia glutinosa TaxID=99300 RepID=A0ABR0U9T5_REHGL
MRRGFETDGAQANYQIEAKQDRYFPRRRNHHNLSIYVPICRNENSRETLEDLFKKAILHPGPPQDFALQTVQQVIKPQSAAVQSGEEIMQYGQSIADGDIRPGQVPRLLDIVLYLCEKEHVEGGMIFQLLEDLTEMSTMRNCKDIFGYIESKQDILGKPELFARGKLVMLRTCNQLLRRLSKLSISKEFSIRQMRQNTRKKPQIVVLNTFEAQPLSDEEGSAINLEDEGSNFSIKYLTSSNLMGLEKEEIKSCEERVKKLLEMTPPRGKEFLHSIEHILERERNWVWWKRDGCPAFEKQPIEKKLAQEGGRKRRPRWRLGNKELSQLWKWADQNPNALTDPQRVRTPAIMDYWKPLAEDKTKLQIISCNLLSKAIIFASETTDGRISGIEEEYHHKNSRFTEHGIEGVVPLELLPPDVRSKYQAKPGDRSKRAKKEETKGSVQQVEESQIATTPASETDVEGSRMDPEASVAPADGDAIITSGSGSQGGSGSPTSDEHQKQNSDGDVGLEAGQIEADTKLSRE